MVSGSLLCVSPPGPAWQVWVELFPTFHHNCPIYFIFTQDYTFPTYDSIAPAQAWRARTRVLLFFLLFTVGPVAGVRLCDRLSVSFPFRFGRKECSQECVPPFPRGAAEQAQEIPLAPTLAANKCLPRVRNSSTPTFPREQHTHCCLPPFRLPLVSSL